MNMRRIDFDGTETAVGVRGKDGFWSQLREALAKREAPCTPSRRNRLAGLWFEFRPRWPKWDLDVYAWHMDKPNSDEEYQYLFSIYQIGWRTVKLMEKELPRAYAEHPVTVIREYSWH